MLIFKRLYGNQQSSNGIFMPSLDHQKYCANTEGADGGSVLTEVSNDLLRAILHDSFEEFPSAMLSGKYNILSNTLYCITQGIRPVLCSTFITDATKLHYLQVFENLRQEKWSEQQPIVMDAVWVSMLDEEDLRAIEDVYQWLELTSSRQRLGDYKELAQAMKTRISHYYSSKQ